MTAFASIDMDDVTRLTRAGRLNEAMALLRGRPTAADPQSKEPGATPDPRSGVRHQPTIDMVAPSMPGGAWTSPDLRTGRTDGSSYRTPVASARRGLSETLRTLRESFPKMAAMPNLAEGFGSPPRAPISVPDGARFEERTFANDVGRRTYKVYVPSGYTGQALPLVVMLHGCKQSPDDFAAGTGMNALAEEQTFLVAYPGQLQSANMQKCWNWFNASDQQREGGEPALIAGIACEIIREFSADPTRVYAAGLSAGGAAASILAATHPDLFAAVGVHSGLPYGAAKDMPSAFAAMNGGGTIRPRATPMPVPTIVFHGDADRTVSPVNADRTVAQAMPEGPLGEVTCHGESPGGMAFTRTVHSDASGRAVLEQWVLHGAGHAWSGGSPDGSYTDPRGPDASREMVRFFMAHASASSIFRH